MTVPSFTTPSVFCYKRGGLIFWDLSRGERALAVRWGGCDEATEDVTFSREEGEALLAQLEANPLTVEDRRVLGKVLTFYF